MRAAGTKDAGVLRLAPDQRLMMNISPSSRKSVATKGVHLLSSKVTVRVLRKDGTLFRLGDVHHGVDREDKTFKEALKMDCRGVAEIISRAVYLSSVKYFTLTAYVSRPIVEIIIVPCQKGTPKAFEVIRYEETEKVVDRISRALFGSLSHASWQKRLDSSDLEFELDSGFVEVKSSRHERATVASVVKEVVKEESRVLKRARAIASDVDLVGEVSFLPHGMYPKSRGVLLSTSSYGGSFHVWITLPHQTGAAFDHPAFVRDHARCLSVMQWLEPLIVACLPGDPYAAGNGQFRSRASMRSRENILSAFGVSRLDETPVERNVLCYSSLADANDHGVPAVVSTDTVEITTTGGAVVNLLQCQRQGRTGRWSYDEEDEYGEVNDSRVDWTMGAGYLLNNEGADVRFNLCQLCQDAHKGISRDPSLYAFVKNAGRVMVARRERATDRFELAPLCMKMIGLEVRIFDHMADAQELVTSIVVLAGAVGVATKQPSHGAPDDADWMGQMASGLSFGSRSPVRPGFWKKLCSVLSVTETKLPESAFSALNVALKAAHRKHGKSDVATKLGLPSKAPVFPDINLQIHSAAVERRKAADPALAASLTAAKDMGFTETAIKKHLGADWLPDAYALRAAAGIK